MAAADRGGEELHGLLREILSLGDTLGGGQGASLLVVVVALLLRPQLAVDATRHEAVHSPGCGECTASE
jgi:hypothetical protein